MRDICPVIALLNLITACVLIGYTPTASLAAQEASALSERAQAEYAATLPKDVHPDSGSRVPMIKREALDDVGKKLYDLQAGRVPGLRAPPGIWLYSPRLYEHLHRETQYLRRDAAYGCPPQAVDGCRFFELAVLVTAREVGQQFAWTAHEHAGLRAGLEQELIDIIKYRKALTGIGEKEAAIIQLGREAIGKRKVSSDTFARALKLFGERGLVDVVAVMARYASIAVLLNTFDQQLYPGWKPLLPIP